VGVVDVALVVPAVRDVVSVPPDVVPVVPDEPIPDEPVVLW
jgi:hypothetical protein